MSEQKQSTINDFGVKTKHTKVIDGHTYTCHLYPAGQGFDLLPVITDVASGPAGLATSTLQGLVAEFRDSVSSRQAVDHEAVTSSMQALAKAISQHGGSQKVKEMLAYTTVHVNGKTYACANDFDTVFQGRPASMLKVLAWVLEVNFAPFSRGALRQVCERAIHKVPELKPLFDLISKGQTSKESKQPTSE